MNMKKSTKILMPIAIILIILGAYIFSINNEVRFRTKVRSNLSKDIPAQLILMLGLFILYFLGFRGMYDKAKPFRERKMKNPALNGEVHQPPYIEQLNINKEDGNSSLCLKAEVSLPWM